MKFRSLFVVYLLASCGQSSGDGDQDGDQGGSGGGARQSGGQGEEGGEAGGGEPGGRGGSPGSGGQGGTPVQGGSGGPPIADAAMNTGSPDAGTPDTARSPDGAVAAGAFACSMFIGPNVTGEWYRAGFEMHVDGNKWQYKTPHHAFVEDWANPAGGVWKESNCVGTWTECETKSQCANGGMPDRIILVTQTDNWDNQPQSVWEMRITSAIATIKMKYTTVKHVELLTFVRGPGNMNCGGETRMPANQDKAHEALAAASMGKITVGPKFEVTACNMFQSSPHLSDAGDRYVAEMVGKHYGKGP
jgi:hypothetical protein